ncbi:Uncharacterized protein TPAR_08213 [Tolypocladium paradoxum]|uniref:Uncharacterized protein n=1 Tax=Tolypocladium paradoxum TaxID=94208 RepID=A0A2S4KMW7_9HYPO|nr:Uncharacterized protein TPAR_08213 [Tolypocladium paradoxum]
MLVKHMLAFMALASFGAAHDAGYGRTCGLKIAPCPEDSICRPNSDTCTDLNVCRGTCVFKNKYPPCGGYRVNPDKCDGKSECRDDPRTPKSCGLACDLPGICIPKNAPPCGGIRGLKCPKHLWCYDDPRDTCDPNHGGADCIGICL